MGTSYSKFHDRSKSKDTAPIHLTLFLPVFGLPNHVEAFIISSSTPYPDDPLFGAFVISPWFEQIPNKLSNGEFFEKYRSTDRYNDNYVPKKQFTWNHVSKQYEPVNSVTAPTTEILLSPLAVEAKPEPNLIELVTDIQRRYYFEPQKLNDQWDEPEGLHYRPKRFDLDTSQYSVIISSTNTVHELKKADGVFSGGQGDGELPSHVPFFKIGLPQPQGFLQNSVLARYQNDIAQLWEDVIYPSAYSHSRDDDKSKVLPFKGLGVRQKFSNFEYNFENNQKKPYTGLGGDGIKTEYDLFSKYKYPRKSLISVRAIDGYSLDTIAHLPHVDTIPAHHLGTVLILDMVNDDTIAVLSQFITKTLEFLQRGCILPLTNVNLWVLQLNGEKLDNLVIGNDLIIEKLTEIGFDLNHIHLCPYELSPLYALPPPKPNLASLRTFPLISKQSLTHFLTPIWDTVYLKTFQLHQEGHWDRLVNRSIKNNPKIRFIPPHIFPTSEYQNLRNMHHLRPKLLKKQFIDAIKGYDSHYHHTDDQEIALVLTFGAMYRVFQTKAKEYFGPLLTEQRNKKLFDQPNQKKGKQTQKPDTNESNIDTSFLNNNDHEFQPTYELLFNDKEPLWDNPRSYFPHIKKLNQFVQNPKPLHFIPEYNHMTLNNGRPLPNHYKAPFVKKLARIPGVESSESESDHDGEDDGGIDVLANGKNNKGNNKVYPRFYTSQSIWPTVQAVTTSVVDHINTIKNDNSRVICNNQNDCIDPTLSPQISAPFSTQISQPSTLSDQIIALGLPKRYEFESFILWADQVVIADQHNMFEFGYFYEPHVQTEIVRAVNRIKFEKNQQQRRRRDAPAPDLLESAIPPTLTLDSLSHSNSHSVKPMTILETLLPPTLMPQLSKTDEPTPFQYLLLTAPNTISQYYPATNYSGSNFILPMWASITLQNRLHDQIYSRMSRLLGHLHLLPKDHYSAFGTRTVATKITLKHMTPPVLRQKHYTAIAPLSYAHTRVEFGFSGGDGKIHEKLVGDGGDGGGGGGGDVQDSGKDSGFDENGRPFSKPTTVKSIPSEISIQTPAEVSTPTLTNVPTDPTIPSQSPISLDSTSELKSSHIEIGLTYLHRCTASTTVKNRVGAARKSEYHCFYASHPLVSSASFIPLAWLHGIFIIPFVYISSRTKLMKQKFNLAEDPIFLNRAIGECPYHPNPAHFAQLIGPGQDSKEVHKHREEVVSGSQEDPLNNTIRSYPPGFIPPPIPPFPPPGGPWSRYGLHHGINQNKSAKMIVDEHRKKLLRQNSQNLNLTDSSSPKPEHSFPFTIPLSPEKVNRLTDLVPAQYDNILVDPCHSASSTQGPSCLASYHSPLTFIVLITNPIYPDPIPYSNIEIPHQVMGCEDLNPIKLNKHKIFGFDQDVFNQMFYSDVLTPRKDIIPFTSRELSGTSLDNIHDGSEDEIHRVKTTVPYFQQPDFHRVSTSTSTSPTTTTTPSSTTYSPLLTFSVSKTSIEDLPSLIEPITQSQFRYYQENIPILYKRQLTEQIYGHGLMGSTTTKLQKLWTVEVHTPQTIKAAMKRIEKSAVETRMRLYRDLALCLQHDEGERRKKAEEEVRLL